MLDLENKHQIHFNTEINLSHHESMIYLAHTRPDIAFSVNVVSQFMHSPYEEHLEVFYRILRYLPSRCSKVDLTKVFVKISPPLYKRTLFTEIIHFAVPLIFKIQILKEWIFTASL